LSSAVCLPWAVLFSCAPACAGRCYLTTGWAVRGNIELWTMVPLLALTEYIAADPGSRLRMHILTGNWDPGYCSAGHNMALPSTEYKVQSNAEHRSTVQSSCLWTGRNRTSGMIRQPQRIGERIDEKVRCAGWEVSWWILPTDGVSAPDISPDEAHG